MRSRLFFIIFIIFFFSFFFSAGKNEKRDNPVFQCFWETENGTIPGKTGQLASMHVLYIILQNGVDNFEIEHKTLIYG